MDVRCERCKTEYEFDDARITEAGVTVKCTTCGHVFKVKKKALVVTVPVKPGELDQAHAPLTQSPSGSSSSGADKAKEWKVRQANGNVFQFKELTTLQKWIVERKVSREDEISLTGESWKRLGNIAELASFFQVVEDAQKAAQLSALQSAGALGANFPVATSGTGYPAMPALQPEPVAPSQVLAVGPAPHATPAVPNSQPVPSAAPSPQSPITQPMMPISTAPSQPVQAPVAAPAPHVSVHVSTAPSNPMAPPPPPPASLGVHAPLPMAAPQRVKSGGGAGKWIGLVLGLAVLGGGGFAGYQLWWLPQQKLNANLRDQAAKAEAARLAAEKEKAAADAKAKAEEEAVKTLAAQRAEPADAGAQIAAAATPDAGAVATSEDGEGKTVPAKAKKEPVHDFNWYMAQGDRLRDRDKAEAALDAYGRAADLEPDRAEPIAGRGLALLDMGSKLQAEAAFQQALKINAKYTVAIMGLAETYRAQGKKDEAIKYYQRYLEVAPQGPEASVAKGAIQKLSE